MKNTTCFRTKLALWIFTFTAFITNQGHAHPGHGLFEHGLTHVLTSPVHLLVLAGFGAGLLLAASLFRDARARLAMRWTGAVAVLLAGLLWLY